MGSARPADGLDGGASSIVSAVLQRWEDSGAVWRVISRSAGWIEISLLTCDAGEEMDRLTSSDRELLDYVGTRDGSDDTRL